MSMYRVFSCVVGRGFLLWPVHFLGKTLSVFALLHSVFQGQICLLLQVFLEFLLLHSSKDMDKSFCGEEQDSSHYKASKGLIFLVNEHMPALAILLDLLVSFSHVLTKKIQLRYIKYSVIRWYKKKNVLYLFFPPKLELFSGRYYMQVGKNACQISFGIWPWSDGQGIFTAVGMCTVYLMHFFLRRRRKFQSHHHIQFVLPGCSSVARAWSWLSQG